MAYRGSTSLGLVLTLAIAAAADVAVAACTQSSEARAVKKSVRQAMTLRLQDAARGRLRAAR